MSSFCVVKILFLSFTCEDVGVAMVTDFWNRIYKYSCLYFSFITEYPSFITFLWQVIALFCCFEHEFKKCSVLCRNFISIYKINRTLHSCLGIRILSSRAESISHSFSSLTREWYFQHSMIKFVSARPCI